MVSPIIGRFYVDIVLPWDYRVAMDISSTLAKSRVKQQRLVKEYLKEPFRLFYQKINFESRGTVLLGPRGTGKTTLLLQQSSLQDDSLYLSLDDIYLQNVHLVDLVEVAYAEGCRALYLDEVHSRNNWSQEVKSLYDSYPKLKITLSDSSSLVLRADSADLSRRFPKSYLPLLSFREFIYLKIGKSLPCFDPIRVFQETGKLSLPKEIEKFRQKENIDKLFSEFLNQGQRPIFLEGRYSERILNLIEKTIYNDIPFFVPSIQKNHLATLKSILDYISISAIPTINIQTLCNQWSIGKDKVYDLLKVLEATGLIQIVYNTLSPKGNSKGDKIFFQDCSFYHTLDGHVGNRREAYFVYSVKTSGHHVLTSKDERHGDYRVSDLLFEVGGKEKAIKKADIVVREYQDDIYQNRWPLWVFGFGW